MVFEYTVKFNGKKYYPGEDVPMDEEPVIEKPVEEKTEKNPLEQAKEALEQKAETTKKARAGRKPKQ